MALMTLIIIIIIIIIITILFEKLTFYFSSNSAS